MGRGDVTAWRRAGTDVLHLFALTGFAVAQPLFDTTGRAPEFFFVGGYHPVLVLVAAAVPSLGVPLVLAGAELLAAAAGVGLRRVVHAIRVAALIALAALPPLNRHWPSAP